MEFLSESPDVDVSSAWERCWGIQTKIIEEGIPNAEGVMMEDVAHVVAGKEQKIAFCEILFDFLERH